MPRFIHAYIGEEATAVGVCVPCGRIVRRDVEAAAGIQQTEPGD